MTYYYMIRGITPVKAAVTKRLHHLIHLMFLTVLMEHFLLAGTPLGNYFANWKIIVL